MSVHEVSEEVVYNAILAILPDAEFRGDEEGFLVIDTGLLFSGWSGELLIGDMDPDAMRRAIRRPRLNLD